MIKRWGEGRRIERWGEGRKIKRWVRGGMIKIRGRGVLIHGWSAIREFYLLSIQLFNSVVNCLCIFDILGRNGKRCCYLYSVEKERETETKKN